MKPHFLLALLAVPFCCSDSFGEETRASYEIEVDASVERVWTAFTTSKGLKSWMAPLVEIEFAQGGTIKANYNAEGKIGDETTIENTILAYDPQRMLALKATRFPKGFPFVEAAKKTWSVFYFTKVSPTRTKIEVVGLGYSKDEDSQKLRSFFATANQHVLNQLKQALGGKETPDSQE